MSDPIKHECGIAFVRLLKPLTYYAEKYGTVNYGLNKLNLLMEKQRNRGQDGVGVAAVKFDPQPGSSFFFRERSVHENPIADVFKKINDQFILEREMNPAFSRDPQWLAENMPFIGNAYLGHLRYGTYGKNDISRCHPFLRENNWMTRNLAVAGNFNLTNVDELFNGLLDIGQHPVQKSDTITMLEKIGHYLDVENERLYSKYREEGFSKKEISHFIARDLDIRRILEEACKRWDGGFCIAGMIGHGDCFVLRDPWGIRPAFVYQDDEVVVVCSERPVIQTAFNVPVDSIKELEPGSAIIIKKDGTITNERYRDHEIVKQCTFERIYFSRGSDADIYRERKQLGAQVAPKIVEEIAGDLEHTVFSFIPNTAESSFYGLMEALDRHHIMMIKDAMLNTPAEDITDEFLNRL
ncbi:MAG: amidophosphoribosyltransferase, partial [Lentisphaeria bacterium]